MASHPSEPRGSKIPLTIPVKILIGWFQQFQMTPSGIPFEQSENLNS